MLLPKRTRKNVKQSKKGCFACRAQRKKCDEEKPTCLRCMRSGKKCEGFADYASPLSLAQAHHLPSPCYTLSTHLQTDQVQSRFVKLGFDILAQQACQDAFGIGTKIWTSLLPRLSSVSLTINAAIASLGATYEAVILRPVHQLGLGDSLATIQYHKALASLRSDILIQSHGPLPSFLTSILLAAVEVLLCHFTNALMHLHGAFTILTECIHLSAESQSSSSRGPIPGQGGCLIAVDDSRALYLIAQALDVQTATFSPSRSPELPSSLFKSSQTTRDTLSDTLSPTQAQSELISLLHACYHYANLAAKYKYLPRSEIPSHIALDQSRCIARLSQWLSKLDHGISALTEPEISGTHLASSYLSRFRLHVLKIQCISAIIYLSTILEHKEKAYDVFVSFFRQIVDCAAVLLGNCTPEGCLGNLQNRFQFISPVSQPLYLTAMKCRHGAIRRRAIHLLGITGREGPWYGSLCMKVAQRAMEIEEEQVLHEVALLPSPDLEDADIKITVGEEMRLHGSGIDFEAVQLPGQGFIEAQFSRCVDVERMITRLDVSWDSKENWDIWTERIAL